MTRKARGLGNKITRKERNKNEMKGGEEGEVECTKEKEREGEREREREREEKGDLHSHGPCYPVLSYTNYPRRSMSRSPDIPGGY
ncbi:hypothetical protein ACN38_g6679 [Penicillium nordicum]|uniref:Uncharacterized protein n=1 Tax=Penicillium nordicum TaxID=229535 RepID=A0A0M8P7Q4_9EURO|nr:hypothetical protein ACN38_g6679 [Penicillium nordicum]